MPQVRNLNQEFFKSWSPAMAYVLGFFAADGSMLRNNRGAHFIEFHITDKEVLDQIRTAVGSNHKISVRNRGGDRGWKPMYRLQIGSKEWFSDLENLGFRQGKSRKLAFPLVPTEHIGDFVRGYFDGDGCVYYGTYYSSERNKEIPVFTTIFTSGSRSFLVALWESLKNHGVKGGYIAAKERGYSLSFSRKDSLALYQLMYHTGPVSTLYLARKRQKLERALKELGYMQR